MARFSRTSRLAFRAMVIGLRHRQQALAQEHQIGGVAADIGSGCRRHRGVRSNQRRCVVETVADHQDLSSRRRDRRDMGCLAARRHLGIVRDAKRRSELPHRLFAIAGQDLHGQTIVRERRDRLAGIHTKPVLEAECRQASAILRQDDDRHLRFRHAATHRPQAPIRVGRADTRSRRSRLPVPSRDARTR